MPIIHFANSKNQNTGGLKKLLGYVGKEKNKESFREASETAPMVVVQEQNWTAVLKVLSSICQSQGEDKHYSAVDRKRLKEEWEKKESLGMHMG